MKTTLKFRIIAKTNPWEYERVAHGENQIIRRDSGVVVWVWKSGFNSLESIKEEFAKWCDGYSFYDDEGIQDEIDNLELDLTVEEWKKENSSWYEGPGWYNDHDLVCAKDGDYYREGSMIWEWESYEEISE